MKLIRMRIALFVMLTSATCLSHASMSWRIAITAATLVQYAGPTFGVQYCDSQLSWKEFLSLSILSSTLGDVLTC